MTEASQQLLLLLSLVVKQLYMSIKNRAPNYKSRKHNKKPIIQSSKNLLYFHVITHPHVWDYVIRNKEKIEQCTSTIFSLFC